jgi:hypothetical protein
MSRGPGRVERALAVALREEPISYDDLTRLVYGESSRGRRHTIGRVAKRLASRDETQLWVMRAVVPAHRNGSYSMSTRVKGVSLPLGDEAADKWALSAFAAYNELTSLEQLRRAAEDVAVTPTPPIGGKNTPLMGYDAAWKAMRYIFNKPREEYVVALRQADEAVTLARRVVPPGGPWPQVTVEWAFERLGILSEYKTWSATLEEIEACLSSAVQSAARGG